MDLQSFYMEHPSVALGFSGGVDSAYLLYMGVSAGANLGVYYVKTAFQPSFELKDAKHMANYLGVKLRVLETDILSVPCVAENPGNRCYYCKKALFSLIAKQAVSDGFDILADGTNASDDVGDRPGMRALTELSVRSPLRECGLTKEEIRRRSKEANLFTWNKTAYACLATRIPTGTRITAENLQRVEYAEDILFGMGFSDFRVRLMGNAAKLQLPVSQMAAAVNHREEIVKRLEPGFDSVLLDMEGRK